MNPVADYRAEKARREPEYLRLLTEAAAEYARAVPGRQWRPQPPKPAPKRRAPRPLVIVTASAPAPRPPRCTVCGQTFQPTNYGPLPAACPEHRATYHTERRRDAMRRLRAERASTARHAGNAGHGRAAA